MPKMNAVGESVAMPKTQAQMQMDIRTPYQSCEESHRAALVTPAGIIARVWSRRRKVSMQR